MTMPFFCSPRHKTAMKPVHPECSNTRYSNRSSKLPLIPHACVPVRFIRSNVLFLIVAVLHTELVRDDDALVETAGGG